MKKLNLCLDKRRQTSSEFINNGPRGLIDPGRILQELPDIRHQSALPGEVGGQRPMFVPTSSCIYLLPS